MEGKECERGRGEEAGEMGWGRAREECGGVGARKGWGLGRSEVEGDGDWRS